MPLNQPPGKRKLFSKAKPKSKEDSAQKKKALVEKRKQLEQESKKLEAELKSLEAEKKKERLKDLAKDIAKAPFFTLAPQIIKPPDSPPEGAKPGDMIYCQDDGTLKVYQGEEGFVPLGYALGDGCVHLTYVPPKPAEYINISIGLAEQEEDKDPLWKAAKTSDDEPYINKNMDSFPKKLFMKRKDKK